MPVEKSLFGPKPKPAPQPDPVPAPTPAPAPVTPPVPPTPAKSTLKLPAWLTSRTLFEVALSLALVFSWVGPCHIPSLRPDATVSAPLKATLIWDADALDPLKTGQAIRADATLGPALKALSCDWRLYDKDSPTLASTGLSRYAGDSPTLVIQVEGVAVPPVHQHVSTPAEVLSAVKKLRGVN